MKNLPGKLTKEEMKRVTGGASYIWQCQELPGEPYYYQVCSANNPAVHCQYNTCYNTFTTCTSATYCP